MLPCRLPLVEAIEREEEAMSEPEPIGPVLRRTFGPETTKLRVVPAEEERRLARRLRLRFRFGIARDLDLDRRLRALGYGSSSRS
jgi:hypothetical protein